MKLHHAWLALLALTLAGWWLGHGATGPWIGLAVLGLTAVKGQWLIDRFMELRQAPVLFRLLLSGWLAVVVGAVAMLST